MTNRISTKSVWDQLEISGKANVSTALIDVNDFTAKLRFVARDYGVSLSIKHSGSFYRDNRLYIYLRKNRA